VQVVHHALGMAGFVLVNRLQQALELVFGNRLEVGGFIGKTADFHERGKRRFRQVANPGPAVTIVFKHHAMAFGKTVRRQPAGLRQGVVRAWFLISAHLLIPALTPARLQPVNPARDWQAGCL